MCPEHRQTYFLMISKPTFDIKKRRENVSQHCPYVGRSPNTNEQPTRLSLSIWTNGKGRPLDE